jgi:hypothetical protein
MTSLTTRFEPAFVYTPREHGDALSVAATLSLVTTVR